MVIIYGIHNCDTVKKALKWLNENNISYQFHDLRKDGLPETLLTSFFEQIDWLSLINKRSTTFRHLSDELKNNIDKKSAYETILAQPTLLKRPLLAYNQQLHLGFKPAQYQELFKI